MVGDGVCCVEEVVGCLYGSYSKRKEKASKAGYRLVNFLRPPSG